MTPTIPGFPFRGQSPTPSAEELEKIDPSELPSLPDLEEQYKYGFGSGFVWNRRGYIVTNHHVVNQATRIIVTFADGTTVEGTLIGSDADSDLAVIKVSMPASQLHPVQLADSRAANVGQLAVAIGNPFGLESTMTVGFISALGRSLPVAPPSAPDAPSYRIPDIIQTDAPINPGNSGGVLVDNEGHVIGVPSAIASPVRSSSGIGFAIPSAIVEKVVPALIDEGYYEHPWIGVSGTTLTPDIARAMNLTPTQHGALIEAVLTGGPADQAGLQGGTREHMMDGITTQVGGDVITSFDGRPVKQFTDIVTYLARYHTVGEEVPVTYLRDGELRSTMIILTPRPTAAFLATQNNVTPAALGISGRTLTPDIAEAMEIPRDQRGVLVSDVEVGSPAEEEGIQGSFKQLVVGGEQMRVGGDVILAIDGDATPTMSDIKRRISQHQPGDTITLTLLRDGNTERVDVTLEQRELSTAP
jgi:S1-C subfamily serine protease